MSLAGNRVLVAAPSALGMPLARVLADAGARVVLQGVAKDMNEAAKADDSIEVLTEPLDTVDDAEALAAKSWDSFGPLAGLVIVPDEAADDFTDSDADWQAAIRSALHLPFFLARAVAARMADAEGGCIVFVVGMDSPETEARLAVNEVTRSASVTMVLALAKALPSKVRVCAVVDSGTFGHDTNGIADTVRFLLSADSLGSGTIVQIQPKVTAES